MAIIDSQAPKIHLQVVKIIRSEGKTHQRKKSIYGDTSGNFLESFVVPANCDQRRTAINAGTKYAKKTSYWY
ncbi:hypothetical protein ACWKWW_19675 [Chryseobacterium cucumeris]